MPITRVRTKSAFLWRWATLHSMKVPCHEVFIPLTADVDVIPDHPEEGILYICEKYHTATHRCCCGCGKEVVTPLLPVAWRLRKRGNAVSLYPSIGNWNFPCRSHYWIVSNRIHWTSAMSQGQIQRVEARDRAHLDQYTAASYKKSVMPRNKTRLF